MKDLEFFEEFCEDNDFCKMSQWKIYDWVHEQMSL